MRLFGFDINVQRREAGVPSSTIEGMTIKDGKAVPDKVEDGANYPDRTVWVNNPLSALSISAYYRAVELRARTMGLMPVQYQKIDKLGGNFITDMRGLGKRMNYLLQVQPNPLMTGPQLWELVTINQIAYGNGFVYLECDELEIPIHAWSVEYGSYNLATGLYNLTYMSDNGYVTKVNVPRKYVLHFPNTFRERGGVWGIPTLRFMTQTLSYIKTQEAQMLDTAAKGGRVKGILTEKQADGGPGTIAFGMLNPNEMEDKAQRMQNKFYRGQDIVAMQGILDFKNISLTAQEMQALETVLKSDDDCARFLGTPRPLLMLDTNSHYNDYQNATMEYHNRTILPEKNAREIEIARKFYELLPSSFTYGYNRIHICERPLMAMDPERQAKVDLLHIQTGVKTVNEVRKDHDQPTVPNGDIVYMTTNVAELGSAKLSGADGKTLEPGNYTVPANQPQDQNDEK